MAEIRVANRTPKPGDIIGTDKSSGTVAEVGNGLVLFDDGFCCSLSVLADWRYLDALPTPDRSWVVSVLLETAERVRVGV